MSQEYIFHAPYGEAEKVEPYLSMYTDNDNLFMGLAYEDPEYGKQPYTDVTVNITKLPYLMAAIDVNNNGQEMMDFLVDNGLAVPLKGQSVRSGFVDYPIAVFNEEALEKIDPKVFAQYQEAYGMDIDYSRFEDDGKETFYYTFGNDERFPFQSGWVEVNADSLIEANDMFRSYFADRNGALNCAFVYNDEEWAQTPMAQSDAPEQICHMKINQYNADPDLEQTAKESSLEELIGKAKERSIEKNGAIEARGDEPTKNPHGMDR